MNEYNQSTDINHNTKKNLKLEMNQNSLLIAAHSNLADSYDFILPMCKPMHGDSFIYNDNLQCFEFKQNVEIIKVNKIKTDNICSFNNDTIKIESKMQTEIPPSSENDLVNKKYVDNLEKEIIFEHNGKQYSKTMLGILGALVDASIIE